MNEYDDDVYVVHHAHMLRKIFMNDRIRIYNILVLYIQLNMDV